MHMKRFLKEEANVVVDRCNFDVQQRKTWIELAQEYNVPINCIVLTTTKQECMSRVKVREKHPTGVEGDKGVMILHKFVKNYYPPTETVQEGLQRILYLPPGQDSVYTLQRIDHILESLDQSPLLS
ncbi:hypothetical protein BY458DRAFT_436522 [Sporodiniella umbellata]|nr:hypothetical protein BY458DRAFT_436522 [Sporodiniella umbellata]